MKRFADSASHFLTLATVKANFCILVIATLIASCKGLKSTTETAPIICWKKVLNDVDTVFLITKSGDTLPDLAQEVDLAIYPWQPDSISIAAVGDIMTGTNFPNTSFLPASTGEYLWQDVRSILAAADITFGNLEGTILNDGGEQKSCSNPDLCYLFRTPKHLTANFTAAGFDLMSVANNHANDFGTTGRETTQSVLDSLGIAHAGSIEAPYTVTKIGKIKVGFCAFAPNRGTISIHNYKTIKSILVHLDSISDIVVASFHAGAEGAKHQHVTRKREFYYREDRGNVYELAHLMVENGADVVLGHGPHIVRAVEVYKDRFIAYSLGNFLTYGRFNLRGLAGEAPLIKIYVDHKGRFISGKIHSFRQYYDLGPRNDPTLSSVRTIQRLSLMDFPQNPIEIDQTGDITYKKD
ncbi:MAG: CapA family protein [Bacteroidota bacterium]